MNEAQPPTAMDSLRNHFLIATPALGSGFFSRSVTYLCDHNEHGAMGIVINQPLQVSLSDVLKHLELTDELAVDTPVMAGGPVEVEHGFVLHENDAGWDSTLRVSDDISLTTSRDILAAIAEAKGPEKSLVALGYAGWGAGQLEAELAENSWLTVAADSAILFDVPVTERLSAAANKLGINIDLMSGLSGHA